MHILYTRPSKWQRIVLPAYREIRQEKVNQNCTSHITRPIYKFSILPSRSSQIEIVQQNHNSTTSPPIKMRQSLISLLAPLAALCGSTLAQSPNDVSSIAQFECLNTFTADRSACALAIINGFPNNISVNQFHSGEPTNFYQLPRTAIGGSNVDSQCRVTVELNVATPVETSWHYVWTMASMLMDACENKSSGQTGGRIITGQNSGLIITIQDSQRGL